MTAFTRRELLACGAAALTASGCDTSANPDNPRRLRVVYEQDVSTIDPATTLAIAELGAARQAYQRLLRPVIRNGAVAGIEGDLAERWEWAPDRSAVTFHLRPGNRFDDGSEVTSEAVAFTFDRVKRQRMTAAQALLWVLRVETPDRYVVRIPTTVFLPFIDHMLWHPGLSIINPRIQRFAIGDDQGSAWLREHSAGSGPYRIAAFAPREEVVLRANPHALAKPRFFEEVVVRTIRDTSARTMQIESGDADIVEFLRSWQRRYLSGKPVQVVTGPSANIVFLHLNNERPPLNDVRVRRAISLAIDRQRLIRSVYDGDARLLNGMLPLGIPGSDESLPPLGYDPAAARALLQEAGVRPGTRLTLTAVTDSGSPSTTTLAIREQIAAIGLEVAVRQVSTAARQNLITGDYEMVAQSLTLDFPDPWIVFNFAFNSETVDASNYARYRNPELDALVARADRLEGDARAALYREAQRIVLRDLPSIPVLQMNWTYAKRPDIAGGEYNFSSPQWHDFDAMYRIG